MSEQLIIALINASALILGALATGIAVVIGANKITEMKRMRMNLLIAYKDIQYLYQIEQYHDEINIGSSGISSKNKVRRLLEKNEQVYLSGDNTLSRINRKISKLESLDY
jgi:hypothetical protein